EIATPPLFPIPLPASLLPLLLPSTSHREDVPKVTLPPQKRLCISLDLRFEVVRVHLLPLLDLLEKARLMKSKARWVQSMDASDTTRAEVMSLRTTLVAHQTKITGLQAADCT
nr:hypothetical protein [Tanacetum cinerariifolium]